MVRNVMEILVDEAIGKQSKHFEVCTCNQCVEDIKCLALNKINPHYVSSDKGELFSKASTLSAQKKTDIDIAVSTAFNIVKSNPRHIFKN
jgi:competence protein ComFB